MKTSQRPNAPCTPLQRSKDVNAPTPLPLYIGQGGAVALKGAVNAPTPDGADLVPAMQRIFDLTDTTEISTRRVVGAGMDVIALAWLLDVPPLRGMTQTAVAQKLGLTKAAVSKHIRNVFRRTGYRRADMKEDRHGPKYSAGARAGWKVRTENDRRYQRAHDELGNVIGARAWFDRLPKHNQRHALVAIGGLPTTGNIREILFVMSRVGWRGRMDLAKRLRRIERAHLSLMRTLNETTAERVARITTGPRFYRDGKR